MSHLHRIIDGDGIVHVTMQIDHIVPCKAGGTADEWNLQVLCSVCNASKGGYWYAGCRYDQVRTEQCRSYFLLGRSYFSEEDWLRFYEEVKRFRKLGTWDPLEHRQEENMAITDKQARNGLPGLPEVANPQPGPMPDVAAVMSQAVAAADDRKNDSAVFVKPSGRDVSYEWDAGLAVSEMPGEA